jgi:hypothetical protein
MTEPKPPKGNRRRNTPDDTRRQLNARKAEQAKPADGALTWRQSEPGESWTMVASPEFYVEADTRDGYRLCDRARPCPQKQDYRLPCEEGAADAELRDADSVAQRAKAIAQADHDAGDDARS